MFGGNNMFGGPNMQQMQQQMLNNPEMMRQMLDNPMMQSMLNNPELMRSILMSNPQVFYLMYFIDCSLDERND